MVDPRYAIPLEEFVAGAEVARAEQVEVQAEPVVPAPVYGDPLPLRRRDDRGRRRRLTPHQRRGSSFRPRFDQLSASVAPASSSARTVSQNSPLTTAPMMLSASQITTSQPSRRSTGTPEVVGTGAPSSLGPAERSHRSSRARAGSTIRRSDDGSATEGTACAADEVQGAAELARLTLKGGTARVREVHQGIAGRVFRTVGPVGRPVQLWHDAVAGLSLRRRRGRRSASARGRWAGAARRAGQRRDLDEERSGRVVLGVLNGAHGDLVQRAAPGLDLGMTVRVAGRVVPLDAASLRTAFPERPAGSSVFLHGLTETEDSWGYGAERHHGSADVTYGTLLQADLGMTPVYLRYNTGLHISENGRELAALLADLVDAWPGEVQDLVLVGHSMGGLVARSALHQAQDGTTSARPWTHLVRDTVTLGSPHRAPRWSAGCTGWPPARPAPGDPSAGPGAVAAQRGHQGPPPRRPGRRRLGRTGPRRPGDGPRTHVPLHDGARHFVVLATLSPFPDGRLADLFGDLLVPPRSALGDTGDDDRLAFPRRPRRARGRAAPLRLLAHPRVYAHIRRWLLTGPRARGPPPPRCHRAPDQALCPTPHHLGGAEPLSWTATPVVLQQRGNSMAEQTSSSDSSAGAWAPRWRRTLRTRRSCGSSSRCGTCSTSGTSGSRSTGGRRPRPDQPGRRGPLGRRPHHGRLDPRQRLAQPLRGRPHPARHRARRAHGRTRPG